MSSASQSQTSERITARVQDPDLLAALLDAEGEMGSRSEAIRAALRETYVEGTDRDERDAGVPTKAREAHRRLMNYTGVDGHIELDAAESILANHLNIKTESVRTVVTQRLVDAGLVSLQQGIHHVSLVVRSPDAADADEANGAVDVDADDPEEADAVLDELAAAGEEAADD